MRLPRIDMLIVSLLVVSVAYNIYQSRTRVVHTAGSSSTAYDSKAMAGRDAPPIPALALTGSPTILKAEGDKPLLLYVLRSGCHFCELNTENMRAMHRQVAGRYRLVGLSLGRDGLDSYLTEHSLPFEIFSIEDFRSPVLSSYGFGATPSLYLIKTGKIERAWGGALAAKSKADVEAFFGIKLPGADVGL